MTLPAPRPGLMIRYGFLWSHEAEKGADEAAEDRPCAIVVAARSDPRGDIRTIVAPVTHTPPDDPAISIEIPPDVCRMLGLDGDRQWLRFDELNRFAWPGFDLRPIPGRGGAYDYGMLPPNLFEKLKQCILRRQKERPIQPVPRD